MDINISKSHIINQVLKIADLHLAVALITLKYLLLRLEKSTPNKTLFVFKRTESIDTAIQSYWNNKLEVSPLEYANNLKTLKTRLYSTF